MDLAQSPEHIKLAAKLSNVHPSEHPLHNPQVMAGLQRTNPDLANHIRAIGNHPVLRKVATPPAATTGGNGSGAMQSPTVGPGGSGGAGPTQSSATDPTGATNPNRAMAYGNRANVRRLSNIRHQLCGFKSVALTATTNNQPVAATPQVAFKTERIVLAPTVVAAGGSIAQFIVGNKNQVAGNTVEPFEVYSATSYAGEVDFDICQAALSISALANTVGNVQFYGALVGLVQAKPIRPKHTKVMPMGLGITAVGAGLSTTVTIFPQIDFVTRKVALTTGATFADAFVINSIMCGNQLQFASQDPVPASVFTDQYDLYLDFDMCNAAVGLTFNITNISDASATFQGTLRGDIDPAQMSGSNLQFAA